LSEVEVWGWQGYFIELIRPGGGRGRDFYKKSNGTICGVQLEATFFTAEISPNGNPKINLSTLSKGFFMKKFNNFDKKNRGKRGSSSHFNYVFLQHNFDNFIFFFSLSYSQTW